MSGSGTQPAWVRRACDRSSSVFSRRGSLQEDRSKDGTSFSAGGGDEGRRRFGVGAAASDMCVGKGARWFWRLPLLGAVSGQLPNSPVSCQIRLKSAAVYRSWKIFQLPKSVAVRIFRLTILEDDLCVSFRIRKPVKRSVAKGSSRVCGRVSTILLTEETRTHALADPVCTGCGLVA